MFTAGTLQSKEKTVASIPFPPLGSSQHLVLIHTSTSQVPLRPGMFQWDQLGRTVLANAFTGAKVVLRTPLEPPLDRITLPPLSRSELRERPVQDAEGRRLGVVLAIPALFVNANRILENTIAGSTRYNYRAALECMQREAARMFAIAVDRGILHVREKPGIMGHAIPIPELAPDEIGISETWAAKVLQQHNLPVADLDGFPVWGLRFPIANEFGLTEMFLRVLPNTTGRFLGFNPWTLARLFLGDADGDLGNAILRVEEYLDGKVEVAERPPIHRERALPAVRARLTVQNLFDDSCLQKELALTDKGLLKFTARYDSLPARLQAIEDADTRAATAVLTITLGWALARVLATSGRYSRQEAYRKAYNVLEWWLEAAMDARKAGSTLSGGEFDMHGFCERLLRGGALPVERMRACGFPEEPLETLKEGWELACGNLARCANRAPIYQALVSQHNKLERSCGKLLELFAEAGVPAEDIWRRIVSDLSLSEVFSSEG